MLPRLIAWVSCFAAMSLAGVAGEPLKPKDGPLGMKFVRVPKGTFYMGWNGTKNSAKKTEIKEDFELAIHTVTQGQWQAVMGTNPSFFSRGGKGRDKVMEFKLEELRQFPVEQVSWNAAQEFIKKLNEQEKGNGFRYRLPSSAEWEYACRGGATTEDECSYLFYADKPTNELSSTQANFDGNKRFGKADKADKPKKEPYLERTTKVGSYPPNKLGLYDMHGNVWQWCEDFGGQSPSFRIIRGGSWINPATPTFVRFGTTPAGGEYVHGFRLARSAVP